MKLMWFPAAVLSCITFGLGSYMYSGSTGDKWSNTMLVGYTQGVVAMIGWAFWRKPLFPKGTSQEIKLLTLACGLCLAVAQASLLMAYEIALKNDLNAGLVNIFSASTSLFGLTASYFMYDDDILLFHTVGCCLNLCGLVMIGASAGTSSDPLFMMFAIIPMFTLGFKQVLVKKICQEISLVAFNFVCFFTMFLFSGVVCILWQVNFLDFDEITWRNAGYEIGGSILGMAGLGFLYYSITYGIVGVAVAVSNSAVLIPTTLSWVLDGKSLATLEFVGMGIGLIGIFVVSLGKEITHAWESTCHGYKSLEPAQSLCASQEDEEQKLGHDNESLQRIVYTIDD